MPAPERLNTLLSAAENEALLARSNVRATWMVVANWALIAGAFTLVAVWPNPITVIVAVLVLGARQLGLAVLNHDCAHYVMFTSRKVNELVGHWLCAGPIHLSLYTYRAYHLKHHQFAGTEADPDLAMASAYPTTPESLRRKLLRDLTGRTGFKDLKHRFSRLGFKRHAPFLATHAVILGSLTLAGVAWAYLLWWVAYCTAYQLVTRLRFMAEHGVAPDRLSDDVRENTCTTLTSWWERLFIAPNYVNYHLEHHLAAGVPSYRLKQFHQALAAHGYFDDKACLCNGYVDVLRRAASGPVPVAA